jgi:hypothetical protein
MNGDRTPHVNRPPSRQFPRREHASPPPPLDRERAVAELNRFLDLAVREMGLAVKFEVSSPAGDEAEVSVTFTGDDQELLLENSADLLLSLEHIAHRWLRLDPRLHDRVRFDCGEYRATRLAELKLSRNACAKPASRSNSTPCPRASAVLFISSSAEPPACAPRARAPAIVASLWCIPPLPRSKDSCGLCLSEGASSGVPAILRSRNLPCRR